MINHGSPRGNSGEEQGVTVLDSGRLTCIIGLFTTRILMPSLQ